MMFKNKKIKFVGLIAMLSSLTACAGNLRGTQEENARLEVYTQNVLNDYFTEDTRKELKGIPVSFAKFDSPMQHAIGFARVDMVNAMWSGMGYGAITVFNFDKKEKLMDDLVIHELTHHAVYRNLIDMDEFKVEWDSMSRDPEYSNLCKVINTQINRNYGSLSMSEDDIVEERLAILTKGFVLSPQAFPKGMFDVYSSLLTPYDESKKDDKENK